MISFFSELEGEDFSFAEKVMPAAEAIVSDYSLVPKYINVVFMNDEMLLNINKEFLNHDDYTDIITFNYSEEPKVLEAELYISTERVKENADLLGHTFEQELLRVIIHGLLHLAGHEDNTKLLKENMQVLENKYLTYIVSRETSNF